MSNEFVATITITSEDTPARAVSVQYNLSHDLTDRVMKGEELPAAFLCARDLAQFVNMSRRKESFNMPDEELFNLSQEDQLKAIKEAAESAHNTVLVTRLD